MNHKQKGHWFEQIARILLMIKGYKTIQSNLKTPVGEVDLLMRYKNTWVVVEVKYRKNLKWLDNGISKYQQQRLWRAARWIQVKYQLNDSTPMRFDCIMFTRWAWPKHIQNFIVDSN